MATTELSILMSYPSCGLHGRQMITTNVREITAENVVNVINNASGVHAKNAQQINYLYNYYRGEQDIKGKTKLVRESINNIVCANHANEIVTFKTAYLLGEPIQYISAGNDSQKSEDISTINDYMREQDKESKDKELADWMHICGVGTRMIIPSDGAESPFDIYTLNPAEAFCVYYSGLGHKRLAGVLIQNDEEGHEYMCVYTDKFYCEVQNGTLRTLPATGMYPAEKTRKHLMGRVPIIEYWDNEARMGAFEVVIPLLNAINRLESDRVDGVQDFVNAYDVFQNCEIDDETYKTLTNGGQAINVSSGQAGVEAKVYRISSELNQGGTQTAIDDMQTKVLSICGMPSLGDGSGGTSDNVGAVIYRQGYWAAESRAKNTETAWIRSEKELLRLVLTICPELKIKVSEITAAFLRNNYSDLQSKTQVLCELLASDKVDPKYAYEASGLFEDSEMAYKAGMAWYEKNLEFLEKQLGDNNNKDGDGDGVINE